MFDWSKILRLNLDTSNLPSKVGKLPRNQRLEQKKAKKAKRRLTNKRKRARGSVGIGDNLGRFSKYQRELY